MHRVELASANILKVYLVTTAAMLLAICLLAFVETTNKAEAASLPQNGKIAFTRTTWYRTGAYSDIYTVNPDGTDLTNQTSELSTSISESSPAWSPDGTKLAFSVDSSESDRDSSGIYVAAGDGSKARRLTNNDDYRFQEVGSWSPDGVKMVLGCYRSAWHVCTMDADGSDHTQLTTSGVYGDPAVNQDPDWSPDGTKIAFTGSSGIYTMNPDGSNRTLVITGGTHPDWSPDGTKMAYSRFAPGANHLDIFVANADGSNPVNLSASIGRSGEEFCAIGECGAQPSEDMPAWSPDGTKIAFQSNWGGDFPVDHKIYVIDVNGHNLKRVAHKPAYDLDEGPEWQPLPTPPPPDTGGPSLILVASALLFLGGVMFYAGLKRRM